MHSAWKIAPLRSPIIGPTGDVSQSSAVSAYYFHGRETQQQYKLPRGGCQPQNLTQPPAVHVTVLTFIVEGLISRSHRDCSGTEERVIAHYCQEGSISKDHHDQQTNNDAKHKAVLLPDNQQRLLPRVAKSLAPAVVPGRSSALYHHP